MKSNIIIDFMPLRVWFKLMIWLLDNTINFLMLSLPIEMMICLCNGPLVIMLIHCLGLPELFMVLWMSLIFLLERLGKFSFSLRMSQTFIKKACVIRRECGQTLARVRVSQT